MLEPIVQIMSSGDYSESLVTRLYSLVKETTLDKGNFFF